MRITHIGKGSEVVVAARFEQGFFGKSARRDKAHNIAFDHRFVAALFRLGRRFQLFSNSDAKTFADEGE